MPIKILHWDRTHLHKLHQAHRCTINIAINVRYLRSDLPFLSYTGDRNPWTLMWRCLHDPTFSHFDTIPACDGRPTDTWRQHTTATQQTDRL